MLRWIIALVVLSATTIPAQADGILFNRDIRPILAKHCLKCHGPDLREGGLRLDHAADAQKILESGHQAIVPGNVKSSALLDRVRSTDPDVHMPPPDAAERLTPQQVLLVEQWIDAGAKWETHWAYVKPARPEVPKVVKREWIRNPIDTFILEQLEQEALSPAPDAEKSTLLRRVTLDLTGLPPTLKELESFLADSSPEAYDKVVERLLASPQYGVRQAIPWLDLARYADTDGYPHDDNRTIWPYRDWVVEAFNTDMPFDQFTIEQLAGDLLPNAADSQRVATGFHRNTRINIEAGSDPETYRIEAVFDRVNTTATVWLGTTLGCAQCHNHKYDPFTQEDYYRLFAIFNNGAIETTTDEAGVVKNASPKWPIYSPEQVKERNELQAKLTMSTSEDVKKELTKKLTGIKPIKTLVMRDQPEPRPSFVFLRGNPLQPGKPVSPGIPELFHPEQHRVDNRLALAKWLVDADNPLTARVAVNRLWMQYFGSGIVTTPEDFGTQAPLASHEKLLDWLATELMVGGWRLKPIHRLIVTSATYRQAAGENPDVVGRDPTNRFYGRGPRNRLAAELVRDNALSIAGLLDTRLGGPSVMASSMGAGDGLASSYRRSIYVYWKRQQLDETFENLDAPSRDVTCSRRIRTNTPLQALNMLNDRVFMDAARGFARRICIEGGETVPARIDFAMRAAVTRSPTVEEVRALDGLYARRLDSFRSDPEGAKHVVSEGTVTPPNGVDLPELAAWILVANTILNLDETFTKE